jgi:uncharacterized repeat protein (TIGR03803 family)
MRSNKTSIGLTAVSAVITLALLLSGSHAAAQEKVLHSFGLNGKYGSGPSGSLIFDASGNLYGTTYAGGVYNYGTVFELTPTADGRWTEKVLHSFNNNGKDGYNPAASLIFDALGNLYGTTTNGGPNTSSYGIGGTVFELSPKSGGGWTEKLLHNFGKPSDGADPQGVLTFDTAGNLYGTAYTGGFYGYGAVFELTPTTAGGWTEALLHSFGATATDGYWPYAGLIFDAAGNLYGTTVGGGSYAAGTVFQLSPTAGGGWTEDILYTFNDNGKDGYNPSANLVFDVAGNLYSTSNLGGTGRCTVSFGSVIGCGAVFELRPAAGGGWTETLLHSFAGNGIIGDGGDSKDGWVPYAGLIFDGSGNLWSTAAYGGTHGGGTVFELIPATGGAWMEKVLHNFGNGTDGANPEASLISDSAGNLYGTTYAGGSGGGGTVFEVIP